MVRSWVRGCALYPKTNPVSVSLFLCVIPSRVDLCVLTVFFILFSDFFVKRKRAADRKTNEMSACHHSKSPIPVEQTPRKRIRWRYEDFFCCCNFLKWWNRFKSLKKQSDITAMVCHQSLIKNNNCVYTCSCVIGFYFCPVFFFYLIASDCVSQKSAGSRIWVGGWGEFVVAKSQ